VDGAVIAAAKVKECDLMIKAWKLVTDKFPNGEKFTRPGGDVMVWPGAKFSVKGCKGGVYRA